MEKKLLVIGDKEAMLIKTVIESMEQHSFFVKVVPSDPEQIRGADAGMKLIFLYVDKFSEEIASIVAARDVAMKAGIKICICAEEAEIESVKQIINGDVLAGDFPRPLNLEGMIFEMQEIFESFSDRNERKSILVVDDDGVILRRMKGFLSDYYNVYIVNSGMTAISLLAQKKIDLILLDYEMPVVSGEKLYEMLKSDEKTSRIPVMFLTGVADRQIVMKILALKPEGYLLKSMSPELILEKIGEFFSSRR